MRGILHGLIADELGRWRGRRVARREDLAWRDSLPVQEDDLGRDGIAALATPPLPLPPEGEQARSDRETALSLTQKTVLVAHVLEGDVLPARFGGSFSDPEMLHDRVAAGSARIAAGLARVAGMQEHGLAQRASAREDGSGAEANTGATTCSPGCARTARARLGTDVWRCAPARATLAEVCAELRPGALAGDLRVNLARLIARAGVLHEVSGALGRSVTLSGPWPPCALADAPEPAHEAGRWTAPGPRRLVDVLDRLLDCGAALRDELTVADVEPVFFGAHLTLDTPERMQRRPPQPAESPNA